MKAKPFVTLLNSLIPINTQESVTKIFDKMKITPRKHHINCNDELSFLMNNYEMEGVEIGIISFLDKYKITNQYFIFGNIDMDYIGFDIDTREFILLDHDETDFVIMKCAKNSIAFLNILKSYSEYIVHGLLKNEVLNRDFNLIYMEAGGIEYKKFYRLPLRATSTLAYFR